MLGHCDHALIAVLRFRIGNRFSWEKIKMHARPQVREILIAASCNDGQRLYAADVGENQDTSPSE